MKGIIAALLFVSGFVKADATQGAVPLQAAAPKEQINVQIIIDTSMGSIVAELYPAKAPATVSNMLAYIDAKFYDGTIFHRVINNFMIQGGGFTRDLSKKETNKPIKNEADNGLKNVRGTLAMARTMIVDSATSQFFVNLIDNAYLDFKNKSDQGWGYCVFGKVVEGLEVIDKIAHVQTARTTLSEGTPVEPVIINSIRRKTDAAPAAAK
jgi:cyclophilin family peptidyl-prolyl cis-trans isomerase